MSANRAPFDERLLPIQEDEWIKFLAISDSIHDFLYDDRIGELKKHRNNFKILLKAMVDTLDSRFTSILDKIEIESHVTDSINRRLPIQSYNGVKNHIDIFSETANAFINNIRDNTDVNYAAFKVNISSKPLMESQKRMNDIIREFMCTTSENQIPVFLFDASKLKRPILCYNTQCTVGTPNTGEDKSNIFIGNSALYDPGAPIHMPNRKEYLDGCECKKFEDPDFKDKDDHYDVAVYMNQTIGLFGYNNIHNIKETVENTEPPNEEWRLKLNDSPINFVESRKISNKASVPKLSKVLTQISKHLENNSPNVMELVVRKLLAVFSSIYHIPIDANNSPLQSPNESRIGELTPDRKSILTKHLLDLKRSGDWLQVLSAYIANKESKLKDKYRFIFVSTDRTAIAFARYMKVPSIHTLVDKSAEKVIPFNMYRPLKNEPLPIIDQTPEPIIDAEPANPQTLPNSPARNDASPVKDNSSKEKSKGSTIKTNTKKTPVINSDKESNSETAKKNITPTPAPAPSPTQNSKSAIKIPTKVDFSSLPAHIKSKKSIEKKSSVILPKSKKSVSSAAEGGGATPLKTRPGTTMQLRSSVRPPVFSPMKTRSQMKRETTQNTKIAPMRNTYSTLAVPSTSSPNMARIPMRPAPPAAITTDDGTGRGLDTPVPRAFIADLVKAGVLTAPYWQPIVRNGYTLTLFEYVVLRTANDLLFADAEASGASSSGRGTSGRASSGQPPV